MHILKPYDDILTTDKKYVMIKSGRDAGKSNTIAKIVVVNFFKYDDLDILITRSNYADLKKSMYQEVLNVLQDEHLMNLIEVRLKPLKIINKINGNIIHFEGIGGSDLSRTKGFVANKKLSLFIVDEVQQLPSQTNLDQALATFRRNIDSDRGMVILAFNPERQNSHWCNEFYRMQQGNEKYLLLYTSYKDIAGVLSTFDLEAIEFERQTNPTNYRYLYLAETDGLFGGTYFTFNRRTHLITKEELDKSILEIGVFSMMIGIDAATTIDSTAFVPVLILNNGQMVVVDTFFHNPKKDGALSNDMKYPFVKRWLDEVLKKYNIPYNARVDMIFDSANADLRTMMSFRLPSRFVCQAYTNKRIIKMAQTIQNAFSRNVLFILDTGYTYNYVRDLKEYNFMPLVTQLESVIWNEAGTGFDKTIPNDATDALTYVAGFYFENPVALHLPQIKNFYERGVES